MPELSAVKKEAPAKWKQALANIHQQGAVRPFGEPEPWPDQREVFFIVDPSTVGGGVGASFSFKVEVRDLGKSGKHGKLKELKLLRKQIADIPDERDRRILAALAGATPSTYSFMGGMDFMPTSFALALPLGLAQTAGAQSPMASQAQPTTCRRSTSTSTRSYRGTRPERSHGPR